MSFHELSEIISVNTPLGHGYAIFVESGEHDSFWTVILENSAVVTFPQEKIRISRSYTHGRGISDEQMRTIIEAPKPTARTPRLRGTPNSMGRMLRKG